MKKEFFNVICLDRRNGWLMFFMKSENNGFNQSHHPLHAGVYTEAEADELVKNYTEFLKKTQPACWQNYCVSKVYLG